MKIVLSVILLSILTSTLYCQGWQQDPVWARVEALNRSIFEKKNSLEITELVSNQITYGHSTGLIKTKLVMLHNAVASHDVYNNLSTERLGTVNADKSVVVRCILRAEVLKD